MKSFGAYLKGEREARKISLEEISRATKIRRAILEAIEQDQGEAVLPEAVVKGFIKGYARHIGLDPKEVMATYAEWRTGGDAQGQGRPLAGGKRRISTKYAFAAGICALILICISLLLFSGGGSEKGTHKAALATPPPEGSTMVPPGDVQPSPSPPSAEESVPLQTPPVVVEETPEVKEVQNIQEVPEVSEVETGEDIVPLPEAEPLPMREHILVITASERTWIQIKEGSSLPFDVILFPGDSFTRTSSQQLAIVIGNAGGVTVNFDGKTLGSPGEDGEVVRFMLPSPEEG
jgi:cytoskeleton protein RodZ